MFCLLAYLILVLISAASVSFSRASDCHPGVEPAVWVFVKRLNNRSKIHREILGTSDISFLSSAPTD